MKFLGIFFILILLSPVCWGNDMSGQARDVLIDKFQRVYTNTKPSNPARLGITLRLADLLAERARQQSMKELENSCTDCQAGEADRRRAIVLYNEAVKHLDAKKRAKVLTQLGHLYELIGEGEKAITLYLRIVRSKEVAPEYLAEAQVSLAEIHFRRGEYQKAKDYYDIVYRSNLVKSRSLAAYRRAWCMFNLGRVESAVSSMLEILQTPALLSRSSQTVVNVDEGYKSEVARDLATFYAKNGSGLSEAKLLFKNSPDKDKLNQVTYLASELERLGQLNKAISVYRFVIEQQADPKERLSLYLHSMQLENEANRPKVALQDFAKALDLWRLEGVTCETASCEEWHTRLRKFVLDWHHLEKKKVSDLLFQAYEQYINTFPTETDMMLWRAQALRQQKKWRLAIVDYTRVIELTISGKATKGKNNKDKLPTLEKLLLSQIELAEELKDEAVLRKTYNKYLALSKSRSKYVEVSYQLAHLAYQKKQYGLAAEEFKKVVSLPGADSVDLKVKAADLALDSLALIKDDVRIEKWAKEFAVLLPSKAKDFRGLARTSVINQTAALAGQNSSGAWLKLLEFEAQGASESEKITFYRNKLVLAEKLKKYAEARKAADQLLNIKSLSSNDRSFALSRKAWLAELRLDFKTALSIMNKLQTPELKNENKSLKLALFAELAGQDSSPYYKKFLGQSKDKTKNLGIALKLVEDSKKPILTLKKYRHIIMQKPEIYARTYLQLHCQQSCEKSFKSLLKDKVLKSTSAAQLVWRSKHLTGIQQAIAKIAKHELNSKTQRTLSRSMSKRIKLIEQLENLLKASIEKSDWSGQLLSIRSLGFETNRFYESIIGLPMPEGLTDAEQMNYMNLLSQQASPYLLRSQDLKKKELEFWNNTEFIGNFQKQYQALSAEVRPLLAQEIQLVADIAVDQYKLPLQNILAYQDPEPQRPTLAELEIARQGVREQPMDIGQLKSLYNLEDQMGSKAMSTYLQLRITQLEEKSKETK